MARSRSTESRYPFTPYPNGWFRVAQSDDVAPGELRTVHFFGMDLIVWRTQSGDVQVFDAYCPHLGAHLGHGGTVEGESIRCPFHHWEFGTDGMCNRIEYAKKIPPKARIESWPVAERNGLVMMYHHRDGDAPSWEVPRLTELSDPDWLRPDVSRWQVRAHWLDMNENCVDQAHFKYIHGTLDIPPTTSTVDGHIHIAESNFRMKVPGGEGDAKLVTIDHGPGLQLVRMSGLIDTLMINTSTPIDEEMTDVQFAYTVKAEGETRKQHLAEAIVKDLRQQFEHDRPIWENKIYRERPTLCDGDGPVASYRKWYSQFV